MNKKGLSYIDWSISLGIFVIFILLLFIMVVPSLDKGLDEDYLISLAETGFREFAYHEIIKMPLFVEATVNGVVEVTLPSYPNSEDYSDFVVLNSSLEVLPTNFYPEGETINFEAVTMREVNTFYVLYLEEAFNSESVEGTHYYCEEETSCTFGIFEKIKGLSNKSLEDYEGGCESFEDYKSFKSELKYPENREISLEIKEYSENTKYSCKYSEPAASDQVYSMSWRDKLLNLNGTEETLTIILRTW